MAQRRASTANPTVPPPEPPEPPDRDGPTLVVARLEPWKALGAIAVALVGAGIAWATWAATVAHKADIEEARLNAATSLSNAQVSTSARLSALQVQVEDLRGRQFAMEAQLADLKDMSRRLLDQTLEIARATGARRIPDPNPPPP